MNEVFRAMKALDFVSHLLILNFKDAFIQHCIIFFCNFKEWKIVNAFHVRVRKKNAITGKYVKMTLQLYQVDYKSYLLDFKSLPSGEILEEKKSSETSSTLGNTSNSGSTSSDPYSAQSQCHHIMEFFEMCASLITQLAR